LKNYNKRFVLGAYKNDVTFSVLWGWPNHPRAIGWLGHPQILVLDFSFYFKKKKLKKV
jgi:hypothetical protein